MSSSQTANLDLNVQSMRNMPVLPRSLHHRHLVTAVQTDNSECVSQGSSDLVLQEYFHKNLLETLMFTLWQSLLDLHHHCWFSACSVF